LNSSNRTAWAAGAALALLPTLVAAASLRWANDNQPLRDHVDPITILVVPHAVRKQAAGEVEVHWRTEDVLVAPAWSGLVTAVPLEPGQTVHEFDTVAVVDGISRLAVRSEHPFHRALSAGDAGDDVRQLADALSRLAIVHGDSTDRVDGAFVQGIETLAKMIGAPVAAQFDPAWFLWMHSDRPVAAVDMQVAHLAPAQGTVIAESRPFVERATLTTEDVDLGGDVVIGVPGGDIEARVDTDGALSMLTDGAVAQLLAGQADQGASGTLSLKATVSEVSSRVGLELPTSATLVAKDGSVCVWVDESAGGRSDRRRVEKFSDHFESLGHVFVFDGITTATEPATFVANPTNLGLGDECR